MKRGTWLSLALLLLHGTVFGNDGLPGHEKAAWARSIYFRGVDPSTHEKLTDQKVIEFGSRLKRAGIHYVYIFSGPYEKDGHLPAFAFSDLAKKSILLLKKIDPELKILPWIGGVEHKTVRLENEEWLKNSIADTVRLVRTMPIDGIHIDLEYVLFPPPETKEDSDTRQYAHNWIKFHRLLRKALPDEFISTVTVSSSRATVPWKFKHSLEDIRNVAREVNQVAFMFYDTGIHDLSSYEKALQEQLEDIRKLRDELGKRSPEYLLGIGAFQNAGPLRKYRDMRFENIPTTVTTIEEAVKKLRSQGPLLDGLAIYCEWRASPAEWDQFSHSFN